jgi:hypothetical protein
VSLSEAPDRPRPALRDGTLDVVVFAGPSAPLDVTAERLEGLRTRVHGPVTLGDVAAAVHARPAAILVVDGYFESVPAVWHKEILWAMEQGTHVFGAASMGALRAAELHPFGMVGVGRIFEWFRDGVLDADDEVAVAHAPEAEGYRAQSEALVNIRATVEAALEAGVARPELAAAVVERARARFYPERSWTPLLAELAGAGTPGVEQLAAFVREGGRVDQKRLDALAGLDAVRAHLQGRPGRKQVRYSLSHTVWWAHLLRHTSSAAVALEDVVDELRLQPGRYHEAGRQALLRRLALDEADRRGAVLDDDSLRQLANDFCAVAGLTDEAAFTTWLASNDLSLEAFNDLVRGEGRARQVLSQLGLTAFGDLPDVLRLAGEWAPLRDRAAHKAALLAELGLADPGLDDAGLADVDELVRWWAAEHGQPVPDVADLVVHLGFADVHALTRALLRERCLQLHDAGGPA